MPQSLSQIYIHLIFGTKNHEPLIEDHVRDELERYMATILKNWESPVIMIGSVSNHVHILFSLSRNYPVRKITEEVKKSSSKWLKTKDGISPNFHWQNGYGAFSVSQSGLQDVIDYIEKQQDHHRHIPFQEEYRKFLQKYNTEFDARYIWD